ncbi:MAG: hydroxyacid dehydrogenase [Candidatus Micrarchaeia archaeon]
MKIIVADAMEDDVLAEIRKLGEVSYRPADLYAEVAKADVLIVRSATKVTEALVANSALKAVARAGVGLDNVDVPACQKKGIKVINTPGASSDAVAELALGFMLSLARKIPQAHLSMKQGKWDKKSFVGGELAGKTLGIVGYGRIGSKVAKLASAFGMDVICTNLSPVKDPLARQVEFPELVSSSDYISIHVALTPETRGMFNKEAFSKMKAGAYVLNLARGPIVDEEALYDALKSGKLAGAALDVYAQEPYQGKLLELDNVVFAPHIGGSTREAQMRIGTELIHQLKTLAL